MHALVVLLLREIIHNKQRCWCSFHRRTTSERIYVRSDIRNGKKRSGWRIWKLVVLLSIFVYFVCTRTTRDAPWHGKHLPFFFPTFASSLYRVYCRNASYLHRTKYYLYFFTREYTATCFSHETHPDMGRSSAVQRKNTFKIHLQKINYIYFYYYFSFLLVCMEKYIIIINIFAIRASLLHSKGNFAVVRGK